MLLLVFDWENINKEKQVSKAQRDSFRRATKAGAKMVFGSDAAIYPHGDNGKQFSRMVQFGMTPLQAIQEKRHLHQIPHAPVSTRSYPQMAIPIYTPLHLR